MNRAMRLSRRNRNESEMLVCMPVNRAERRGRFRGGKNLQRRRRRRLERRHQLGAGGRAGSVRRCRHHQRMGIARAGRHHRVPVALQRHADRRGGDGQCRRPDAPGSRLRGQRLATGKRRRGGLGEDVARRKPPARAQPVDGRRKSDAGCRRGTGGLRRPDERRGLLLRRRRTGDRRGNHACRQRRDRLSRLRPGHRSGRGLRPGRARSRQGRHVRCRVARFRLDGVHRQRARRLGDLGERGQDLLHLCTGAGPGLWRRWRLRRSRGGDEHLRRHPVWLYVWHGLCPVPARIAGRPLQRGHGPGWRAHPDPGHERGHRWLAQRR